MREHQHEALDLFAALPLSPPHPCPYFGDRPAQMREFRLSHRHNSPFLYEMLIDSGYRRCGNHYYQPNCPTCRLCLPYRLPVAEFCPSRSQRRVLRRNRDLEVRIGPPQPSQEKEGIYLDYQHDQHHVRKNVDPDRPFDPAECLQTMYFQMYFNPPFCQELELRHQGQLLGFGTMDVLDTAASAVYFVFDPEHRRRSLGIFAILQGIEWAREQGLAYYHLGFFIPGHPEMDYKRRFGPAEILDWRTGTWASFTDCPPGWRQRQEDALAGTDADAPCRALTKAWEDV